MHETEAISYANMEFDGGISKKRMYFANAMVKNDKVCKYRHFSADECSSDAELAMDLSGYIPLYTIFMPFIRAGNMPKFAVLLEEL